MAVFAALLVVAVPGSAEASYVYRDAVLATPGLVDYWRLGEAGGTTLFSSTNDDHATATDGVTFEAPGPISGDAANRGVRLDGLLDHLDADPGYLGAAERVSVEAWVKVSDLKKVHTVVTNAASEYEDGWTLAVWSNNKVRWSLATDSSTAVGVYSPFELVTERWYHLVGTY
ncbi:MAG: LamG domain-containing protein, partial [Actinomycetota bacterium]|nr:LamG domain-containing protein [Actinomycetota bacterium]